MAQQLSKSALVAPILMATPNPCSISSHPIPMMWRPTTWGRGEGGGGRGEGGGGRVDGGGRRVEEGGRGVIVEHLIMDINKRIMKGTKVLTLGAGRD